MHFFHQLKNSIYGPKFYQELQERSFGYSFGYFLLLLLLLLVVSGAIGYGKLRGLISRTGPVVEQYIVDHAPDDFEFSITGGQTATSTGEPVRIPTPLEAGIPDDEARSNILVIDPVVTDDALLARLSQEDTYVLIGQDSLAASNGTAETRIMSLEQVPDTVITPETVGDLAKRAMGLIPLALLIALPFLFGIILIWLMLLMIPASLVIMAIDASQGVRINFARAYRVSLHVVTLPLVYVVFGVFMGLHVGLVAVILFILVALFNLRKLQRVERSEGSLAEKMKK